MAYVGALVVQIRLNYLINGKIMAMLEALKFTKTNCALELSTCQGALLVVIRHLN